MMGFAVALPILQVFYRSQASAQRFKTAEAVLIQAHRIFVYNDERRSWQRYLVGHKKHTPQPTGLNSKALKHPAYHKARWVGLLTRLPLLPHH